MAADLEARVARLEDILRQALNVYIPSPEQHAETEKEQAAAEKAAAKEAAEAEKAEKAAASA